MRIQAFKSNLYHQKTNPDKLLTKLLELGAQIINVTDKNILADYFTLLSSGFQATGTRDSAIYYNDKAMGYYEEIGNFGKVAQIRGSKISRLQNSIKVKNDREKILQLIPKYETEIEYAGKQKNKYVLAYNTRHLAQIYLNQTNDFKKAMKLFKTSLQLREEIGFKPYLPASYSSVGDVAYKMSDEKLAVEMYKKSISLAEKIGFVRYQFHPRIKIGDIYKTNGNHKQAEKFFNEALASALKNGYQTGVDEANKKIDNISN